MTPPNGDQQSHDPAAQVHRFAPSSIQFPIPNTGHEHLPSCDSAGSLQVYGIAASKVPISIQIRKNSGATVLLSLLSIDPQVRQYGLEG